MTPMTRPKSESHLLRLIAHLITFYVTTLAVSTTLVVIHQSRARAQSIVDSEAPLLVPDRPGYADSTSSVDPGHWHMELGGAWRPSEDSTINGILRYGLKYGWELRLMSPTLTQVAPFVGTDGQEVTPELSVGGAQLGAKWAKRWSRIEFSSVLMVGVPVRGAEQALTPDPLVSLGAQISHPLNHKLSTGLAFRYGLQDGSLYGQEVAYGEELTHYLGMVAALSWSEVDWSIFTQAGAEVLGEVVTPLVGGGLTLRISRGSQVDLSMDAPLASDGVNAKYMAGLTLSW